MRTAAQRFVGVTFRMCLLWSVRLVGWLVGGLLRVNVGVGSDSRFNDNLLLGRRVFGVVKTVWFVSHELISFRRSCCGAWFEMSI